MTMDNLPDSSLSDATKEYIEARYQVHPRHPDRDTPKVGEVDLVLEEHVEATLEKLGVSRNEEGRYTMSGSKHPMEFALGFAAQKIQSLVDAHHPLEGILSKWATTNFSHTPENTTSVDAALIGACFVLDIFQVGQGEDFMRNLLNLTDESRLKHIDDVAPRSIPSRVLRRVHTDDQPYIPSEQTNLWEGLSTLEKASGKEEAVVAGATAMYHLFEENWDVLVPAPNDQNTHP